jgi:hypothetical protein
MHGPTPHDRQREWLHDQKTRTPIGIFGSFRRLYVLTALRDNLNQIGYHAKISTDLATTDADQDDGDVYNRSYAK